MTASISELTNSLTLGDGDGNIRIRYSWRRYSEVVLTA